jgi:chemotaxis protein CheD
MKKTAKTDTEDAFKFRSTFGEHYYDGYGARHETPHIVAYTGEVTAAGPGRVLMSSPLGSCIAVCAYDPGTRVGGLAHVMLPGVPPAHAETGKDRYAAHALETLFSVMQNEGADPGNLLICLIGGANVLRREHDTIHIDNLRSLTSLILQRNLPICRTMTGGSERMMARMETKTGRIFQITGNNPEEMLFDYFTHNIESPDN